MESSPEPLVSSIVEPLPRHKRQRLFLVLLLIFVCAVPVFVFYATGYRYDFFNTETGVTATGGLYIGVSQNTGEIYLNDEPARGSRIFRRATYIQSVSPGIHRVHVQGDGLQTWVKDLPVFPHMVTEADAFLLPVRPNVRLIASSTNGDRVVLTAEESALVDQASSVFTITNSFTVATSSTATTTSVATTSTAPSRLDNIEYQVLQNRFDLAFGATSSATSTTLLPPGTFRFAEPVSATSSLQRQAATIISRGNVSIVWRDGELFAQYLGSARSIPHYFCVPAAMVASTTELYGAQVAYGIDRVRVVETSFQPIISETIPGDTRICRNEIRLDTKGQEVIAFDFFPGSSDQIVVQQTDGVYVVEIDDRAWQNVQTLISQPVDAMVIDNNRIFIQIDTLFFEVSTDLSNT